MPTRKIQLVKRLPSHAFDKYSGAFMMRLPEGLISPFLGIDLFSMPSACFGPHPHAGMSAVTVMLPESEGAVINRDSLGDHSVIAPGDLHWTQAGRGMIHEEVPQERGKAAVGLQVFVNLQRADKQTEPFVCRVAAQDMPVVPLGPDRTQGASLRVVAGEYRGYQSPIAQERRWLTQVNIWDLTVPANQQSQVEIPPGHNAFLIFCEGSILVQEKQITNEATVVLFEKSAAAAQVAIESGETTLRAVMFTGMPIDEPVVAGGPFTGSSVEEILSFQNAFTRGDMGSLSPTE